LDFSQTFDGPLRYGASIRFETIPSSRDDPLQPYPAGVLEDGRAVVMGEDAH
jgi:hypothetical protein